MFNISDIFFNHAIPFNIKHAVLDIMDRENITDDVQVLIPTDTNDDVNGSTHVSQGGTDFTYRDATEDDVQNATSLGYYEYFGAYGYHTYTGHYYDGADSKFAAIVIDPPAYAATVHIR